MGVTAPSRDMLVRAATPSGSSGKVFGFVYSGLDVGSLIAPPVYGWFLDRGEPRAMVLRHRGGDAGDDRHRGAGAPPRRACAAGAGGRGVSGHLSCAARSEA